MYPNPLSGAPSVFVLFFAVICIIIAVSIIIAVMRYAQNATSPVLQAHAKVIGKRTQVTGHSHIHDTETHLQHDSTTTRYFITFELENTERIELVANGRQYGLLVEGDIGTLTYQGEWYKDFAREAVNIES